MLGRLESFPMVSLFRAPPPAVLPRYGPGAATLIGESTYDEAGFPN